MKNDKESRKHYFNLLKETWGETRAVMLSALEGIAETDESAFNAIMENQVLKKRLAAEQPKVRPLLLRLSFEVCGGDKWRKVLPACAAVELLNISTYVMNALFDEKGGEKTKEEKDNYIITSQVLRELAEEKLLEISSLVDKKTLSKILGKFSEINKAIYLGQDIDLRQLKINNLDKFNSFEEIKKLYFKRVGLFCGRFMENVACIGAMLAEAEEEQIAALRKFGFNYGCGVQIANDLGDFIPYRSGTVDFEKIYQDQYSDLKQGKLTLATILALEKPEPNKILRGIGKKNIEEELTTLTKYINDSEVVKRCKEECIKRYHLSKQNLEKLEESSAREMLSVMASMLRTNKYFSFFREMKAI